jgi:hypothetical protein
MRVRIKGRKTRICVEELKNEAGAMPSCAKVGKELETFSVE